ncbi:MAG: hypothetical protein OEW33_09945 [Nitrospirota bacterium]|nr:hypothetical protein [Nitrospirota bacterium]
MNPGTCVTNKIALYHIQMRLAIGLVEKDTLAPIAARGNMMGQVRNDGSGCSETARQSIGL